MSALETGCRILQGLHNETGSTFSMRTFVIIAFAVVAVLLVPVSQFVKAQIGPPQGN